MLSIISILISLASFGFSLWTWKSQGKKAKYMNLEFITFANHAVFSYNSKRPNSENLFMLGPSIEIDLDVLNPSSLPLIPNDIVIVKPYSTYRLTTIFQGKVNMPDTFTDFQFRFRVVSKNPFGNGFEDQIYRLDISDYPELSRRTLDPGKLVPKIVLHQIDSAL